MLSKGSQTKKNNILYDSNKLTQWLAGFSSSCVGLKALGWKLPSVPCQMGLSIGQLTMRQWLSSESEGKRDVTSHHFCRIVFIRSH